MTQATSTLTAQRELAQQKQQRSLWSDAWRRLKRNRAALIGLVVALLLCLIALLADVLAPYSYSEQHIQSVFKPMGTPGYVLGTDNLGRDVLSRLIYGARISLGVALLAQFFVLVIGVPVGLIAG